ncbi:hypothetical protein NAC44_02390 [Allorhizobium sp. BGMRC 0089]|uniref:hypothetical protein n=1 Tax=Allorhizobium sonneratiae TaxID=2934936 RepID=UPI002033FF69|nr:hypothetical protein [Allorhizobium sonneratiae]MCM2291177.1 hypothetical protein [Allorhizobium sonneratiae]
MNKYGKKHYTAKYTTFASAVTILMGLFASSQAFAGEVKLASPDVAAKACKENKMGQWDISYIIGKGGIAQWGPGYGCKQSPVPADFSGVGNAINAEGATVTLEASDAAMQFCKSKKMGQWDIAYITGKGGVAQWGPGYGCKQSPVPAEFSGVGDALTK